MPDFSFVFCFSAVNGRLKISIRAAMAGFEQLHTDIIKQFQTFLNSLVIFKAALKTIKLPYKRNLFSLPIFMPNQIYL